MTDSKVEKRAKRPLSNNFPTAVAMCAVAGALRPFLRHKDVKFTAILQTHQSVDDILYHWAADNLLEVGLRYDDFGNNTAFITTVDGRDYSTALTKIIAAQRVVILTKELSGVDEDIRLLADVEIVLDRPKPEHFLVAARRCGFKEMTVHDARYLASLEFKKVRMAVRQGRSLTTALGRLRRAMSVAKAKELRSAPNSPTRSLRELAGYGEAATWGLQLADDIEAWRAGLIDWEDVDRGVVLHGKPGCGKTTYGRALAATCGLPIIEASSARWQATGHLGDMLKAMRRTFAEAEKQAPCILFLDEIDAFGDRLSDTAGDNLDYKRQVIDALLECLDPPEGRSQIVVVGATNFPELLDPALLRPGRLERLIRIPPPDADARLVILQQHLRGVTPPTNLRRFIELTTGLTGADIELIARDVRRITRKERRELTEQDLLASLPESRELEKDEIQRLAVHEAGHAVVSALLTSDTILWVTVRRRLFNANQTDSAGFMEYRRQQRVYETEESLTARINVLMAGIAAERVFFGKHSTSGGGTANSDLSVASDLATMIERQFGFGDTLAVELGAGRDGLEKLRASDPVLRMLVEQRLRSSLETAEAVISDYRQQVDRLASWLVERQAVSGEEVRALLTEGRTDLPGIGISQNHLGSRPHSGDSHGDAAR